MAYLSANEHTFANGKVKSIVCTASNDATVKAWDVQEVSWTLKWEEGQFIEKYGAKIV